MKIEKITPDTRLLVLYPVNENRNAIEFCKSFRSVAVESRYIFGRNEYAESIASQIEVSGFVDEFTDNSEYFGKPVIKPLDLPPEAMVVSAVIGRPLTVRNKLKKLGVRQIDYFAFYRYSGLDVKPVRFWNEFKISYQKNKQRYDLVYSLFTDEVSKQTLEKVLNFRLLDDLDCMEGFTDRQDRQYFEDFLELQNADEVFVDVGGFDGYTSLEFIKRCPDFRSIHFFEPEKHNIEVAKSILAPFESITFHELGLSDRKQKLKFQSSGSTSMVSEEGILEIDLDRLDKVVDDPVTFIKMDIEGGEKDAIEGAKNCILKYHPRLAICVYHKCDDIFQIPEQVLSIRSDYQIYLRHYTEGVDETVMFFMPDK